MQAKTRRFDHALNDLLAAFAAMQTKAAKATEYVSMFRRHAYRFAKCYMEIESKWHNEMVRWVESGGHTLDSWLEEHFGLVETMGENRKHLTDAIRAGMTEKEYLSSGVVVWEGARPRVRAANRGKRDHSQEVADDPAAGMDDRQRASFYQERCLALRSEIRELRRAYARLQQDHARLQAHVKRIAKVAKIA